VVASRPCHFTPGERALSTHWIGSWVDGCYEEENNLAPAGNQTLAMQLIAIPTELSWLYLYMSTCKLTFLSNLITSPFIKIQHFFETHFVIFFLLNYPYNYSNKNL
jgi:hypothetical protein